MNPAKIHCLCPCHLHYERIDDNAIVLWESLHCPMLPLHLPYLLPSIDLFILSSTNFKILIPWFSPSVVWWPSRKMMTKVANTFLVPHRSLKALFLSRSTKQVWLSLFMAHHCFAIGRLTQNWIAIGCQIIGILVLLEKRQRDLITGAAKALAKWLDWAVIDPEKPYGRGTVGPALQFIVIFQWLTLLFLSSNMYDLTWEWFYSKRHVTF